MRSRSRRPPASEIRKSRRPSPRWRGRTSSDPAPGTSCAGAAVIVRRRMSTRFTCTPTTWRVRERAAELASAAGIAIEHIAKNHIRKEDVVARVLVVRADRPGLVHIISAMEACDTYKPWHDKHTHRTFLRPDTGNGKSPTIDNGRGAAAAWALAAAHAAPRIMDEGAQTRLLVPGGVRVYG